MDARDKLRQYLEQRREMGESELVLDNMTVDEALRIVGAKSVGKKSVSVPAESTAGGSKSDVPVSNDWRAALRDTGAAPAPRRPDATLSEAKGSGGPALVRLGRLQHFLNANGAKQTKLGQFFR